MSSLIFIIQSIVHEWFFFFFFDMSGILVLEIRTEAAIGLGVWGPIVSTGDNSTTQGKITL